MALFEFHIINDTLAVHWGSRRIEIGLDPVRSTPKMSIPLVFLYTKVIIIH